MADEKDPSAAELEAIADEIASGESPPDKPSVISDPQKTLPHQDLFSKIQQATGLGPKWEPLATPYGKDLDFAHDPVTVPNSDAIKQTIETEKLFQDAAGVLPHVADIAAKAVLTPLQLPQQAATGLFARTVAAGQKYDKGWDEMAKAFKSPQLMQLARERAGFKPEFAATLDQARKSGVWDTARAYINEIFPEAYPSDLIDQSTYEYIAQSVDHALGVASEAVGFPKSSESESFQNFLVGAQKFGIDVATDPIIGLELLPKIPQAKAVSRVTSEMGISERTAVQLQEAAERELARGKLPQGLAAEAARGERKLIAYKIPFKKTPIFTIEGQSVLQKLDEVGNWLERASGSRPYLTRSGIGNYDAMDTAHEVNEAAIPHSAETIKQQMLAQGQIGPQVGKLANDIKEYDSVKLALLKNPKATDEMLRAAHERLQLYDQVNELGNAEMAREGVDLTKSNWKTTKDDQEKLLRGMSKSYGEIPRAVVMDGNVEHDITFSRGYDYGRALSKEAKAAKGLEQEVENASKASRATGLNVKADAARGRVRLSTEVFDEALRKKYGLTGPAFNPNKDEVVLASYTSKLKAANDLRFVRGVKESYGTPFHEIQQVIDDAAERVRLAKKAGLPVNMDDVKIRDSNPNQWRRIDNRVFDQMKYLNSDAKKTLLATEELYYPAQIADRVEAKFFRPQTTKKMAIASYLQQQWAKNALTSTYRLGKQSVDNLFRALSLDVSVQSLTKEWALSCGMADDAVANLYKHIPTVNETVLDMSDFEAVKHGVDVSVPMLTDRDVNTATNAWTGGLYHWAKNKAIPWTTGVKSGLSPKSIFELMNDNALSRGVRHMGNYSDGLIKKAYFRDLIKKGYDVSEATRMVGDHLMDFGRTTEQVRGMRWATPFAAWKLKNLETLPALIAMHPNVTNIINPYSGSLKRAIEDSNGWDPYKFEAAHRLVPYMRHPILGPLLRGNEDIAENPSFGRELLNQYVRLGATKGELGRLNGGTILSFELPTNLNAAVDMFDLTSYNEQMYSPAMAAFTLAFLNTDIHKEKQIDSAGTEMGVWDGITKGLAEINPLAYPKFFNRIVVPALEKGMPSLRERLKSPVPRRLAEIMKLQLGPDFKPQKLKLDETTMNELTGLKFFGMGRLDKADFNYYMQQLSLYSKAEDLAGKTESGAGSLVMKKLTKEGRAQALEVVAQVQTIMEKMRQNTLIYKDFKARMGELSQYLSEEDKAIIYGTKTMLKEDAQPNIPVEIHDETLQMDQDEKDALEQENDALNDEVDQMLEEQSDTSEDRTVAPSGPFRGGSRRPQSMLITEPREEPMFDVASNKTVQGIVEAPKAPPGEAMHEVPVEISPLQKSIDKAVVPPEEESVPMEIKDLPQAPPEGRLPSGKLEDRLGEREKVKNSGVRGGQKYTAESLKMNQDEGATGPEIEAGRKLRYSMILESPDPIKTAHRLFPELSRPSVDHLIEILKAVPEEVRKGWGEEPKEQRNGPR